jgi:hypothetical protein
MATRLLKGADGHNEASNQFKETTMARHKCIPAHKAITFHEVLEDLFDGWASACGWEPDALRLATTSAIRRRHRDAIIEHEANRARGRQPDVWTLDLGGVRVIYTVEPKAVMVRGYTWDVTETSAPDDGGGHYTECDWHR